MDQRKNFWEECEGLVMFVGCMLVFLSAMARRNVVPSSFMNPTLIACQSERAVMSRNPNRFYMPRFHRWWLSLEEGV